MMRVPPGGTAYFDADPDEDTIEMVLTPADVRLLARAAEEQQQRAASVAEPAPAPPPPPATESILSNMPSQTTSTHNSASLARGALAGIAAGLVIVVAIASLSTTRLTSAAKPNPPPETHKLVAAAAEPAAAPAISEPSQPAIAQAQPLRFKNPFDKSEIFEFPAGTTLEEARASVADLLRQRAQDRHIRPGLQHSRMNGAATRRSAKQADIVQSPKRG